MAFCRPQCLHGGTRRSTSWHESTAIEAHRSQHRVAESTPTPSDPDLRRLSRLSRPTAGPRQRTSETEAQPDGWWDFPTADRFSGVGHAAARLANRIGSVRTSAFADSGGVRTRRPRPARPELSRHKKEFFARDRCARTRTLRCAGRRWGSCRTLDGAVDEMRRCMRRQGFLGVEIGTKVGGTELADPDGPVCAVALKSARWSGPPE